MGNNSFFTDEGAEVKFVVDEKLDDDTNLTVKVKGDDVEIHFNPKRIFSTLNNKNLIIASVNKKLTALLMEFKSKVKFKQLEDSKYWDVLVSDVVYEKLKDTDKFRLLEAESLLEGVVRVLLNKKEMEENKRLQEDREIDKTQSRIDKKDESKNKG